MKPNGTVKKVLYILSAIFLVVALGLVAYNLTHVKSVLPVIANLLFICTILAAAGYCAYGAKKKVAVRFIVFLWLFAVTLLFGCGVAATNASAFRPVMLAIMFAVVCVLAIAKDLGYKKSMTLGGIAFAASAALLLASIIRRKPAEVLREYIAVALLTFILNLFIQAKYENKAERGSK